MLYKCERCNKEFNQKSNYNSHLNRKNPCKNNNIIVNTNTNIINNIIPNLAENIPNLAENTPNLAENNNVFYCKLCNKKFTTNSALSRHVNFRCKENKIMIELKNLKEENKKLKEENELLKKQLILLPKTKSKTTIHNQTNIENQNNMTQINNITINFGDEDMSKLTEEEILTSLKSLSKCFQTFVKTVHLNSRLPEYNNILINNMRSNYGYVIEDNKFILKDKNQIIADLISIRIDDLESFSIDYRNKLCSRELSLIKDNIEFLRTAYIETEDMEGNIVKGEKNSVRKLKDIYKQLLFMFYDNKNMIQHKLTN